MKRFVAISILVVAACGGDSTAPGTDAGVAEDSMVAIDATNNEDAGVDLGVAPSGDFYELDDTQTVPNMVQCQAGGGGYIIAASASNRTGMSFYFRAMPAVGSYTIEVPDTTAVPIDNIPASETGVVAQYSSDPAGGTEQRYYANSGSVEVTLVEGKLHASATDLPATDIRGGGADGTVGGELTCP